MDGRTVVTPLLFTAIAIGFCWPQHRKAIRIKLERRRQQRSNSMNCCRYQNSQVQRPFFFCYFWTDASSAESSINELCPTHVTQHVIVLCGFYLAIIRHCLSFFSLLDLTIATIIRGVKQLAVEGILQSVLPYHAMAKAKLTI